MNKEGDYQERIYGDFGKNLRLEELTFGSDNYRAVSEALEIARMYRLKYESGPLSRIEEIEMEIFKNNVTEINNKSPIFVDKFNKICAWVITGLTTMPAINILIKIELLKDKIKEARERVDLV